MGRLGDAVTILMNAHPCTCDLAQPDQEVIRDVLDELPLLELIRQLSVTGLEPAIMERARAQGASLFVRDGIAMCRIGSICASGSTYVDAAFRAMLRVHLRTTANVDGGGE